METIVKCRPKKIKIKKLKNEIIFLSFLSYGLISFNSNVGECCMVSPLDFVSSLILLSSFCGLVSANSEKNVWFQKVEGSQVPHTGLVKRVGPSVPFFFPLFCFRSAFLLRVSSSAIKCSLPGNIVF